ncbi:MAG: hypothetical protein M1831_003274 [Alyxoria varia]|nr:MAG: hypothetical protein M1831_003274 [Alyxoria varia]
MSNRGTLEAATQDRKGRLAQLKTLKRKQQDNVDSGPSKRRTPDLDTRADAKNDESQQDERIPAAGAEPSASPTKNNNKRKTPPTQEADEPADADEDVSLAAAYLSGRNYDSATRAPKLGFEADPLAGRKTVESQAKKLVERTRKQADEEETEGKPLDLFKLQPKKPNWDLKRDLEKRMEVLNVRTDNAIARMVRERVAEAQKEALEKRKRESKGMNAEGDEGEEEANGEIIGMEGNALVEATREMEREGAEENRELEEKESD